LVTLGYASAHPLNKTRLQMPQRAESPFEETKNGSKLTFSSSVT
jgi:hypothetical protein